MKRTVRTTLAWMLCLTLSGCLPRGVQIQDIPQPVGEPTAAALALPVETLTGRRRQAGSITGLRVVAVVVENNRAARPHRGLNEAGIVFEMPVEGGITRLLAFYENAASMPVVGNVRSNRRYFTELAIPFGALLVMDGESPFVAETAAIYDYNEFVLGGRGPAGEGVYQYATWRIPRPRKAMEYTSYTDGETILEALDTYAIDGQRSYQSTYFLFAPEDAPRILKQGHGETVDLEFSASYQSRFVYDGQQYAWQLLDTGGWVAEVDENTGVPTTFDNLLVLWADVHKWENSELLNIDLAAGGEGIYYNGGRCEAIRWRKKTPLHGLELFYTASGEDPVTLNAGTTYVAVLPSGNLGYHNQD